MRRLILAVLLLAPVLVQAQERIRDVIYMKQAGCAFTMDVFEPAKPNHKAILDVVSGGWFSNHDMITPDRAKEFNDHGFTVFEVVHGSQPKYTIPEIVPMIRRAVRFIRFNAATYDVSPNAIGIVGYSSGGHLSLEVAGLGDDGDPAAKDPVDRVSSRVQAVVAFFPPVDLLNWGAKGVSHMGIPSLAIFTPAFGVTAQTPADKREQVARDASPIYLVKGGFPPTLIIHGDSDKLVPVQQAHEIDAAFDAAGVTHKLVISPGTGHDEKTIGFGFAACLDWFDAHLSAS